ncbi:hypothetical protein WAI453_001697 [Rhynchosporium graminicola]
MAIGVLTIAVGALQASEKKKFCQLFHLIHPFFQLPINNTLRAPLALRKSVACLFRDLRRFLRERFEIFGLSRLYIDVKGSYDQQEASSKSFASVAHAILAVNLAAEIINLAGFNGEVRIMTFYRHALRIIRRCINDLHLPVEVKDRIIVQMWLHAKDKSRLSLSLSFPIIIGNPKLVGADGSEHASGIGKSVTWLKKVHAWSAAKDSVYGYEADNYKRCSRCGLPDHIGLNCPAVLFPNRGCQRCGNLYHKTDSCKCLGKCHSCSKPGHTSQFCPSSRCTDCGRTGHLHGSPYCPSAEFNKFRECGMKHDPKKVCPADVNDPLKLSSLRGVVHQPKNDDAVDENSDEDTALPPTQVTTDDVGNTTQASGGGWDTSGTSGGNGDGGKCQ